MKIAIFTDSFSPLTNGVVTSIFNLVKGLSDKGHEIIIIAPKYRGLTEFKYKNVKVIRAHSVPAFFYPDFRFTSPISPRLLNTIRKEKVDVIHFETPITLGFQGIMIAKLLRKPLVGTFHTFFADPQYIRHAFVEHDVMQKFAWKYSNFYYNQCDLITSPSKYTKTELQANKCKPPIKVISNGMDERIFDNQHAFKMKNKYNKDGEILLFVGRIAYEKNIEYLIDCFEIASKKNPTAKLLIVGDGPQMKDIKNKIKDLKLKDKILMLGKIKHEKLVKSGLIAAADLFVTASITENQPMTILEAQGNGVPCIGVDAKGVPDLIIHNKNGLIAKYGDKKEFANAITKMLQDKEFYDKMQTGTIKEIKKHSLDNVISEWEKTYKDVIDKNNQKENILKRMKNKTKDNYNKVRVMTKENIGKVKHETKKNISKVRVKMKLNKKEVKI